MDEMRNHVRRILDEFEIDEISAVDRPAQEYARMTIMKRQETRTMNFLEIADAIQKRTKCPANDAQRLTRQLYPSEFQKFQGMGAAHNIAAKASDGVAERGMFNLEVEALVAGDPRISRTMAMSRIRKAKPDLFKAAFG